ncbi:MAG: hypothetical protein LBT20_00740 [Clostridiales bacterium]|nr:hypothetical protein [Clostridiales bacterium]
MKNASKEKWAVAEKIAFYTMLSGVAAIVVGVIILVAANRDTLTLIGMSLAVGGFFLAFAAGVFVKIFSYLYWNPRGSRVRRPTVEIAAIVLTVFGVAVFFISIIVVAITHIDGFFFMGLGGFILTAVCGTVYGIFYTRRVLGLLRGQRNSEPPRTAEKEAELLEKINSAYTRTESKLARAEYYGVTTFLEGLGFTKENKEAYRNAPKAEKAKVIAFVGALAFSLLVGMVGIAMGGSTVGFVLMGIGLGGFAAIIFILMIRSLIQRRSYKSFKKHPERHGDYHTYKGTVERCIVHSQHQTGEHTPNITGTLYQCLISTADGKTFWATSADFYEKGQSISYCQNKKHPKCRYII